MKKFLVTRDNQLYIRCDSGYWNWKNKTISTYEVLKDRIYSETNQAYEALYDLKCRDCPTAVKCHEDCMNCEEFDAELQELEEAS